MCDVTKNLWTKMLGWTKSSFLSRDRKSARSLNVLVFRALCLQTMFADCKSSAEKAPRVGASVRVYRGCIIEYEAQHARHATDLVSCEMGLPKSIVNFPRSFNCQNIYFSILDNLVLINRRTSNYVRGKWSMIFQIEYKFLASKNWW